MADILITDQTDLVVTKVAIDLEHPSSLIHYLASEALHLAVLPDLLERKDETLSKAATQPIRFEASAQHGFKIGGTDLASITVEPSASLNLSVNASPGAPLFAHDAFAPSYAVPPGFAYVGLEIGGKFSLDATASKGDLSFGFNEASSVTLQYFRSFALGAAEPKLLNAVSDTLSHYVIPATVADLGLLGTGDLATVAGSGSLQISGSVDISAFPNPLASATLPLIQAELSVQAGIVADVSIGFTVSCDYQVRARRIDAEAIELTITRNKEKSYSVESSGSGGFAVDVKEQDLLSALIGAISKDPTADAHLFASLSASETNTLASAIRAGVDHHLKASIDLILSAEDADGVAFQYEVRHALLNSSSIAALNGALHGDLRMLTAMEKNQQAGGKMADGIMMRRSLLTATRQKGVKLDLNLLGILNFASLGDLVRKSEVLTDGASGDVTIKETVTGDSISALSDPLDRNEALRKAMFDSVLTTTTYRAGKAVLLADLNCAQVHFAENRNTSTAIIDQYLRWCANLNVLTPMQLADARARLRPEGPSTCVLRTSFADKDCDAMFFGADGNLRRQSEFLEIGRRSMRACLDPANFPNDELRKAILEDRLWPRALSLGPVPSLGSLVGLSSNDPRVELLIGDVYLISQWADNMTDAALQVQSMRSLVQSVGVQAALAKADFQSRREALQKKLAGVVRASKVRFAEPWGMLCLYGAANCPLTSSAKIASGGESLAFSSNERPPSAS